MLHYVHQVVSNCVCLLFAAEQVMNSSFLRDFSLQTAAAAGNKVDENEVCGPKIRTMN